MTGRLTTHVLDLSRGMPAIGLTIQLWRLVDGTSQLLCEVITNSDGRLDAPLLQGGDLEPGCYELLFGVGDYYRGAASEGRENAESPEGLEVSESQPFFLEQVPIRFHITSRAEHYHVPLLVAPGGYSTYRGS